MMQIGVRNEAHCQREPTALGAGCKRVKSKGGAAAWWDGDNYQGQSLKRQMNSTCTTPQGRPKTHASKLDGLISWWCLDTDDANAMERGA